MASQSAIETIAVQKGSIRLVSAKKIDTKIADMTNVDLSLFKQNSPNHRDVLVEQTMGATLFARRDLIERLKDILDRLEQQAINIISITPDSGKFGDTVKIVVGLGSFSPSDCKVYFESENFINTGIITDSRKIGEGKTEFSVSVPDFSGAGGDVPCSVCIKHYKYYVVNIPDINTPPQHFSILDSVSNSIAFTWKPSAPTIVEYWANYHYDTLQVEPNTQIQLLYRVNNAKEIQITRTNNLGPDPAIHDVYPTVQGFIENTRRIGTFSGDSPREEIYTLKATNPWGSTTVSIHVKLRKNPFIRILGGEVIQAIQHFTLDSTGTLAPGIVVPAAVYNNSIGLIERKKTMLRLYVESGMSGGFHNNAGPDEQPNIVGKVTLTLGDGTKRIATTIRNSGGKMTARPKNLIDRNNFEHTLDIELPWDCLKGTVAIDARVWVNSDVDGKDHATDVSYSGYAYDKKIGTFKFKKSKSLRLVRILVKDDHFGIAEPSSADYWKSVKGLLARYPIANDGVTIALPLATGDDVYETDCDLSTIDGWEDLIDDIADVADEYNSNDEYWTAVVPNNSGYKYNGIGQVDGRCLVAKATLTATFPHEFGHNLGFGHSDCGNPDGVDNSLPAHTNELGLDVDSGELIPSGYGDLMSYCYHYPSQKRWPSIILWNKLCEILVP